MSVNETKAGRKWSHDQLEVIRKQMNPNADRVQGYNESEVM